MSSPNLRPKRVRATSTKVKEAAQLTITGVDKPAPKNGKKKPTSKKTAPEDVERGQSRADTDGEGAVVEPSKVKRKAKIPQPPSLRLQHGNTPEPTDTNEPPQYLKYDVEWVIRIQREKDVIAKDTEVDVQTLVGVTYTNLVTKWGEQLKIKASSHNLLLNEIYITAHINSQSE